LVATAVICRGLVLFMSISKIRSLTGFPKAPNMVEADFRSSVTDISSPA
jgi:hypothetical protein